MEPIILPDVISSRVAYKRKFTFLEMYNSMILLPQAFSVLSKNKKSKLVSQHLTKRMELAVTEVNGCAACSYQHTKMALNQGMSNEEINSFLSGGSTFIQPAEGKAILFAQHFADSTGRPKKYAFDTLVNEYGAEEAEVMLAAIQVMIFGNMYGIPFSAFQSRRKGKPFKESKLSYELGMMIFGILVLPIALIHGLIRKLFGVSTHRFDLSTDEG
jgi:AhpD family alkylhydroperoxidase